MNRLNDLTKEKGRDLNAFFTCLISMIAQQKETVFNINEVFESLPHLKSKNKLYLRDITDLIKEQTDFVQFNGGNIMFFVSNAEGLQRFLKKGGFVSLFRRQRRKRNESIANWVLVGIAAASGCISAYYSCKQDIKINASTPTKELIKSIK